ncbi:putative protein P1 [Ixeridium yellow mottle virus 1]|uniref:putative protein P1 n=1 Tax=Ixeridium yellow mottle virus 1 TaxID=1809767 RepID=UPI0007828BFB|nr:putative protein P1 [Ixeridium yellow mottle virus 1]AMQ22789.1 putative protein P1 [Ixeridium yellow mottle virus 1]
MEKHSIKLFLLGLFFSSFPFFFKNAFASSEMELSSSLALNQSPFSNGLYSPVISRSLQCPISYELICVEKPPGELISESYNDLIQALLEKSYADALSYYFRALETCARGFATFIGYSGRILSDLVSMTLWFAIFLWLHTFGVILSIVYYLMTQHTVPTLILVSLTLLTRYIIRRTEWVFGELPYFVMRASCFLLRSSYQALSSSKSYIREKAVAGFTSYSIPQAPPKNSVLELVHPDGSHLGYATCISLFNGENALITALHCVNGNALVKGKTGNKIPLKEFAARIEDKGSDFALFSGPPSWESLVGCKGARFVTSNDLARCSASLYKLTESGWISTNAKVVGPYENRVSVLSETFPGDSGAPYWNGKTVLGVHTGAPTHENINVMTPIPHIPGVTAPIYVYETTAPQGKIFAKPLNPPKYKPIKLQNHWDDRESEGSSFYDDPEFLRSFKSTKSMKAKFIEECEEGDHVISAWLYSETKESTFLQWATTLLDAILNKAPFEHDVYGDISTWFNTSEVLTAIRSYEANLKATDIYEESVSVHTSDTDSVATAPSFVKESLNEPGSTACPPTGNPAVNTDDTPKTTPRNGDEIMERILSLSLAKINFKGIEDRIVSEVSKKVMPTVQKRAENARKTSPNTSKRNTTGRRKAGSPTSPAFATAGPSQATTTRKENKIPGGEKKWLPTTPNSGKQ